MKGKWLLSGVLAAAGVLALADVAQAQQVGFGRGFNYNPYSAMPPGFYQGYYYGVPGTPFVRFRGDYSGPGGSGVPGGQGVQIDQTFRDTPLGTAMRSGGYGPDGGPAAAGYGLLSPTTRSYGARVGTGAYVASRTRGPSLRRDVRELRSELDDTQVQIRVLLPSEDAKLLFEDTPTEQQGVERIFMTPSLERGTTYTAKLTAVWKENGKEVKREKKVDVRVGREAVVDFTEADAPQEQEKPKPLPPE